MSKIDLGLGWSKVTGASKGPWTFTPPPPGSGAVDVIGQCDDFDGPDAIAEWVVEYENRRDASFIVYAREMVPVFLDHVAVLRAALREACFMLSGSQHSPTVERWRVLIGDGGQS